MPEPSPAAIRELAHQILARSEYAHAVSDKRLEAVERAILEELTRLGILRVDAPVLYWTIMIGLVAVLGAMIFQLVRTLRSALRMPQPEPRAAITSGQTPVDPIAQADRLAANGRYLEAAHRLMLASFRALAERSVIELTPERSNRWIREALRGSNLAKNLAGELDELIGQTEHRWFGKRENDPEIYAIWRSAFERLSSALA